MSAPCGTGRMRVALMLAAASIVSARGTAAPLTAAQWVELRTPGQMEWSGDGAKLALSVTEPADKTSAVSHIWVFTNATHALRQYSRGDLYADRSNFLRPAYRTVGAALGFKHEPWAVSLYGKNLTNERPALEQDTGLGYYNVSTLRPRQIGLNLKRSF